MAIHRALRRALLAVSFFLFAIPAFAGGDKGEAQLARFEQPMAALDRILLSGKKPGAIVDELAESNGRIHAFKLQGLLHLYREAYPELEEWREKVKALEHEMGVYADSIAWIKTAERLGLPEEIISHMKSRQVTERTRLATYLSDHHWLDPKHGATKKLRRDLREISWMSYSDDREYIVGQLKHHLKHIQNTDYDMGDLAGENGLHKFRRDIRWFLIFAEGLNGMVLLDDKECPLKQYRPLLDDPLADSPYLKIPASFLEKKPCYLPKCLMVKMTEASEKLGAIKDVGEAEEIWLPKAVLESGYRVNPDRPMTKALARKLAREWVRGQPGYVKPMLAATPIYTEVHDGPLLHALHKTVKGHWPKGGCGSAKGL